MNNEEIIRDLDQLEALYDDATPRSITKEIGYLNSEYRNFVEAARFMAVATVGDEGLDCSPRGEQDSVVRVVNETTIQFADRRGNNRLDTLRNIIRDNRIGLLFLVPGVSETMRINGRARISIDPELLGAFAVQDKTPKTVVEVTIEQAYFQCSKALVRSGLWDPENQTGRAEVPTAGQMLEATAGDDFDSDKYDAALQKQRLDELW
ncbi:MAG: pyridoxamine 5'-phosphate oxidase family protein [Actinomycetota bacterium]|nr:pyridoxamine 5'-phosphate oxidase family protein [Actinomycetota bacterium]